MTEKVTQGPGLFVERYWSSTSGVSHLDATGVGDVAPPHLQRPDNSARYYYINIYYKSQLVESVSSGLFYSLHL